MTERPPVSILLPTTSWTDACTELAAQLENHDELLIIHGVDDDPVIKRQNIPEGVRLIGASGPQGVLEKGGLSSVSAFQSRPGDNDSHE